MGFEGAELLVLVCGLEATEELTVSELGVEGPFEIPEVVVEFVGECLEAFWREEDEGVSTVPSSPPEGDSVEHVRIKAEGCSCLF